MCGVKYCFLQAEMFRKIPGSAMGNTGGDHTTTRLKTSLTSTPEKGARPRQDKDAAKDGQTSSAGGPQPAVPEGAEGGPQPAVPEGGDYVASLIGHAALANQQPFSRPGSYSAATSQPLTGRRGSSGEAAVVSWEGGVRPSSQASRLRSSVFAVAPAGLGDDERFGSAGTGSGSGGSGAGMGGGRQFSRAHSMRSQKSTQIEAVAGDLVKKFDKQLKVRLVVRG